MTALKSDRQIHIRDSDFLGFAPLIPDAGEKQDLRELAALTGFAGFSLRHLELQYGCHAADPVHDLRSRKNTFNPNSNGTRLIVCKRIDDILSYLRVSQCEPIVNQPFRALETPHSPTRKDEVVIAAVNAFACLTRPTKFQCSQLEDLVLATLDHTNEFTRRLVAACLSNSSFATHSLVMRLCDEPTDICAPLLLRSPVLLDQDLVALILKNGVPFARVIARRNLLSNNLRGLLLTLGDAKIASDVTDREASPIYPEFKVNPEEVSEKLEAARSALRKMMQPESDDDAEVIAETPAAAALPPRPQPSQIAAKLRATALQLDTVFFITALADLHGLSFERAKRILERNAPSELMTALRAADLPTADACIIAGAFFPEIFKDKQEVSLFLTRYDGISQDQSANNVRRWKADEISAALRAKPANHSRIAERILKAS